MIIGISGYVGNRLTGIGRVLINILSELAKQYPVFITIEQPKLIRNIRV